MTGLCKELHTLYTCNKLASHRLIMWSLKYDRNVHLLGDNWLASLVYHFKLYFKDYLFVIYSELLYIQKQEALRTMMAWCQKNNTVHILSTSKDKVAPMGSSDWQCAVDGDLNFTDWLLIILMHMEK